MITLHFDIHSKWIITWTFATHFWKLILYQNSFMLLIKMSLWKCRQSTMSLWWCGIPISVKILFESVIRFFMHFKGTKLMFLSTLCHTIKCRSTKERHLEPFCWQNSLCNESFGRQKFLARKFIGKNIAVDVIASYLIKCTLLRYSHRKSFQRSTLIMLV